MFQNQTGPHRNPRGLDGAEINVKAREHNGEGLLQLINLKEQGTTPRQDAANASAGDARGFQGLREYFTTDRMTTEEFVPWLVTSEWDDRCNRTIERLIRQAGFRYQASVDHIDYSTERGIDCNLMQRLAGLGFYV